ncbi:hypothetical protein GOP47_0016159 [Adiantum capillus-veneris]|uniref:Uncharacterized protein n=1 Tax=Adiantum capillus-veneris TaxID=13818 RepID=A0A9D4UM61_ADICA|nr:hypothetical protein GOP47_0016159 [Adiantum capillus-veneris]
MVDSCRLSLFFLLPTLWQPFFQSLRPPSFITKWLISCSKCCYSLLLVIPAQRVMAPPFACNADSPVLGMVAPWEHTTPCILLLGSHHPPLARLSHFYRSFFFPAPRLLLSSTNLSLSSLQLCMTKAQHHNLQSYASGEVLPNYNSL